MPPIPPRGAARRRHPNAQPHQGGHVTNGPPRQPCTLAELKDLDKDIAKQFSWIHGPRPYQMEAIIAQLQMKDVWIHAGTGLGKTAVAAGPHVHKSARGKVTIMVSPLIALHDEMVDTFQDEFKLTAMAVNSSNGGSSPETLRKIIKGECQIVLISPELLLSRRFIAEVLKNAEFKRRVLSVVVDEAHVISHWGNGFRKKYGELGILRSFLSKSTPIVAMSATMAGRVRRDVIRVLRFDQSNTVRIDVGNDRPNVSIVIRSIHYPLNTYADTDFVINKLAVTPMDILKTFVYCDNIAMGTEIIDHLNELLPPHLCKLGIIRPYNACFSKEYRKVVMDEFKTGTVRILVCTDAAGMGCNIPDVDLVVQWKLPGSISAFVQRAGRAARAPGRVGLAVLLAEPSAYTTMLDDDGARLEIVKDTKRKRGAKRSTAEETKTKREYGILRGSKRGSTTGEYDSVRREDCPTINHDADDEGLLSLVQSGTCRRAVLTIIFGNNQAAPTVPCCDICKPELLNRTRPGLPSKVLRQKKVKVGEVSVVVRDELHRWRLQIKARDHVFSPFSAHALLPDTMLMLLSSVGHITTQSELSAILGGQWGWESTYGGELYAHLMTLNIAPCPTPLPKAVPAAVATKRALVIEEEEVMKPSSAFKRARRTAPKNPWDMPPIYALDVGTSNNENSSTFLSQFSAFPSPKSNLDIA